jgi:hypothetical protein
LPPFCLLHYSKPNLNADPYTHSALVDTVGCRCCFSGGRHRRIWYDFLATYFLNKLQWKRSRQDKKDDARREAIKGAIAWLEPIHLALFEAEGRTFQLLSAPGFAALDEQEFSKQYPDLLHTLSKLDPPPDHQLLLPKGSYEQGNGIIRALEDLKYTALKLHHETQGRPGSQLTVIDAREQCANISRKIRQQYLDLKEALAKAYHETYDG